MTTPTAWTPPTRYRAFVDYVQTYLWVVTERGELIPFTLNDVQHRYLEMKDRHLSAGGRPRFLILKPRRTGISTIAQAENYYVANSHQNRSVVTLAHTEPDTEKIFKISKTFHRNAFGLATSASKANKREFTFHDGLSDFYTGTAGSRGFGRGSTLHRAHLSEVAYFPFSRDEQETLLAGITDACREGEVVLETTAHGATGLFYDLWQGSTNGENDWCRIFIPWWWDPKNALALTDEGVIEIADTLAPDEHDLIARVYREQSVSLTPNQIAWRRMMRREKGRKFPQEYPEDDVTAFIHSGVSYFDGPRITELVGRCKPPLSVEHVPGGTLTIWREPEQPCTYVTGTDCAEGVPNGDWSVTAVIEHETGEQAARLRGHWRAHEHAALIAQLGERYKTRDTMPLAAVERNNHGHAVIQALMREQRYPAGSLYHHMRLEDTNQPSSRVGWETNSGTRPLMLQGLAEALEDGGMRVNDREFLRECQTFVQRSNGKYEAESGEHDDLIFAWGIAWQARQQPVRRPAVYW